MSEGFLHGSFNSSADRAIRFDTVLWALDETRVPIETGMSGARVVRVQGGDGSCWIEKSGPGPEIVAEAEVLRWCAARLPVPRVIEQRDGILIMSELPGVILTDVSLDDALKAIAEALARMHSQPIEECPFSASWSLRLQEAAERIEAGLVDEADFDGENSGRNAASILAELKSFPPLPGPVCFTHGDACLENFLSVGGRLSGIIDVGRAGLTHPAQDWALALRSVEFAFGA